MPVAIPADVSPHLIDGVEPVALEEALGTRLVTRSTRRMTLTEPGCKYLEACRRILEELDAAEAALSGLRDDPQGELAITAPVVFGRLG